MGRGGGELEADSGEPEERDEQNERETRSYSTGTVGGARQSGIGAHLEGEDRESLGGEQEVDGRGGGELEQQETLGRRVLAPDGRRLRDGRLAPEGTKTKGESATREGRHAVGEQ